jgi:hypothetical protein
MWKKPGNENIMRLHNQLFILRMAGFVQNVQRRGGVDMRREEEIKKALKELRENRKNGSPLTERQNIAWHGTKQALEWVLEQTDTLLTY